MAILTSLTSRCRVVLSDQLREAQHALKDANRELADLRQLRAQLEAERDSLAAALKDTEDALRDAENKLANAQNALATLRTEMETRLREKDEEIENIKLVILQIMAHLRVIISFKKVVLGAHFSCLSCLSVWDSDLGVCGVCLFLVCWFSVVGVVWC